MVINDAENMWMVTFYADWCPYCEPFAPEYEAAQSDSLLTDKKVKFGALNVMENRDLTQRYQVTRTPTVKIFGSNKEESEDYSGHRQRSALVKFINDYAVANEYVEAKPDDGTEYWYNIETIVKDIAGAHSTRIKAAESAH